MIVEYRFLNFSQLRGKCSQDSNLVSLCYQWRRNTPTELFILNILEFWGGINDSLEMIMVASVRYLTFRKLIVRLYASQIRFQISSQISGSDFSEECFFYSSKQHRKLPWFVQLGRDFVCQNFPEFGSVIDLLKRFTFFKKPQVISFPFWL